MALGHRTKGEEELAWNAIKKVVHARINLEVAVYREKRVNELLDELWPQFEAAMNAGELKEADFGAWLKAAVENLPQLGPGA